MKDGSLVSAHWSLLTEMLRNGQYHGVSAEKAAVASSSPLRKVLLQAYPGPSGWEPASPASALSPCLLFALRLPECRLHLHWHQGLLCCKALGSPGSGGQSAGLRMFTGSAPAISSPGREERKQGGKRESLALMHVCLPASASQPGAGKPRAHRSCR